ncbi:MAG: endolytic transglycosylase MltG [Terricaulis sp.]
MARYTRPAPHRRSSNPWGCVTTLLSFGIVALLIGFVAMFAFQTEANREGPAQAATDFVVPEGASLTTVGKGLEHAGLVRSALFFRAAMMIYERGKTIQAGEYEIPARASLHRVAAMLATGEALQHPMTFPEGITVAAAMKIIAESDVLSGPMPEAPPEGSLMPDTYHVQRGMTRVALIQQMRDARDAAVAEIWANRDPTIPATSPEQLVTLASIVERETGIASERAQVAAAFTNRLRRPMRLESDPTIIYGVCKKAPSRCREGRLVDAQGHIVAIRQSDMAMNTGYNTYKIDGLPPTPICNPGRAALEATAHPAQSNAIYFVADGTGGHAFAATLAEHQANVARWRTIETQRLAQEHAEQAAANPPPQPAPRRSGVHPTH